MTQSAVQISSFRAPMHTDCSLPSCETAQTPTILPDVPGEKNGQKSRKARYRAISGKHPVMFSGR